MDDKPLSVAISALIHSNKVLLIKRLRGDYVGLWGLPGGKIEKQEHLSEAAVRKILEESGIPAKFKSYLGFVSEHLVENGEIKHHFLLHLCELHPEHTTITRDGEGRLDWFDLTTIEQHKTEIIPSDYLMIEKIIKNKEKNYYNCVIEKKGKSYLLRRFE